MNSFDHFVKDDLRVKHYLRYTDDFIIVHENPVALLSLLPPMRAFLKERLALDLHPRKIELRKLSQGIDFLGYVILHRHRLLRAKTGGRIVRRAMKCGPTKEQLNSYLGLLSHCEGFEKGQLLRRWYLEDYL